MKITVLMHEGQPSAGSPYYLIQELGAVWREQGHEIEVSRGVGRHITGDIVFLHVDATVVPQRYLTALACHPRVVNRGIVDISRTLFSRNVVRSRGDWDGPVIVKTVRNSGGHPERRLARTTMLGRLRDILGQLSALSLESAPWLDPSRYPIFQSARDVPLGVWRNPALFVERFMPERQGELYCNRVYWFLGDRHVSAMGKSREPVIHGANLVAREEVSVHPAIVAARHEMGFEFGKFDYVMHGGEPQLLDVSRTPGGGAPGMMRVRAELLSPGLAALMT